MCEAHSSRKLKKLPVLLRSSSEVIKLKTKNLLLYCGEVKLSREGGGENPNGNPSLVCKKLFFPQENFNENGYRFMGYSTFCCSITI